MNDKKGLELPINMIVVVAIAVLVLVVVAAFFAGRLGQGTGDIALEGAFSQGCNTLRTIHNCAASSISLINVRGYTPPGSDPASFPNGDSFSDICLRKGFDTADGGATCAKACGCTGV